jgi:hypothetical protein
LAVGQFKIRLRKSQSTQEPTRHLRHAKQTPPGASDRNLSGSVLSPYASASEGDAWSAPVLVDELEADGLLD